MISIGIAVAICGGSARNSIGGNSKPIDAIGLDTGMAARSFGAAGTTETFGCADAGAVSGSAIFGAGAAAGAGASWPMILRRGARALGAGSGTAGTGAGVMTCNAGG